MKFKFLFFVAFVIFNSAKAQEKNSLSTANWETLTCVGEPEARHEACFVKVADKFYLLGGRKIKPVNIFDPATKTWSAGAKPPIEIHHFQAIAYKNKIYVICAMTGLFPAETPLKNILIYDTKKDEWETGSEIPEGRRRGSAGIVVNKNEALIACGIINGHNGNHVNWMDSYNFKTGKWKVLADAPKARDHFSAALKDGKIYCAGGRNTSALTNQTFTLMIPQVDVYDIKSNIWTTLPEAQNLPTLRAGTSTAFVGNKLLVIGGESGLSAVALDVVEAYDIKSKSWETLKPLNQGRHGTLAILHKNAIYLAAGCAKRGGKPELSSIEKLALSK
jgi:N-acetylneuraminic acid mutarotase